MALTSEQRGAVADDFERWLSQARSPTALGRQDLAGKVAQFDLAIEAFLAGVADVDLSEIQLDWLLRRLAQARFEVKHG